MPKRSHCFFLCGLLSLFLTIPLLAAAPSSSTDHSNSHGMIFIRIPAGQFSMGQANFEEPVHQVTLSQFYLAKYETSYKLWAEIYKWAIKHGYDFNNSGNPGYKPQGDKGLNPVANINWYDAVKWCNALSEKEGKIPCYYTDASQKMPYRSGKVKIQNDWVKWTANGYRLPTEAEWEYAERAGTSGLYIWGKDYNNAIKYAYWTKSGPVGTKLPNQWGLYDIVGNVQEWCWDWEDSYSAKPQTDPTGPLDGGKRIVRGGTCCQINLLYSAHRSYAAPALTLKDYGFRVACKRF